MRIQIEQVGPSIVTVELDGRLDSAGAADVQAQLTAVAAANKGVVIDLAKVSLVASVGIRLLLQTAKIVQRQGGRVVLLDPVKEVRQVLEVTGLSDLLTIHNDRNQALLAVARQGQFR